MRVALLLCALAVPLEAQSPAASASPRPVDSLALARQYTRWFYTGQVDSLMAHHPAAQRGDSAIRAELEARVSQLALRAGTEVQVLEEKFVRRNGRPQYWRTARFTDFSEPILLRWVINPSGEIVGMGLGPLSQAPPIDP
ncbi:MAG TPA: hypothetical protein VGQ06_07190 [Gemmatimonadales bacterium]|jgi:hypothetical protein|nr:hypothetical protein [Gemmatimonadales bacterium]